MPSNRTKPKVMLDSGAYSAWSHSKVIDIREYIKFVKQVKDHVWKYVNLDVIPGSIERVRTREEVEASAKLSYENLQRMRDAGLRPLPVFHQGESFAWLEKMIGDGEDYIGISTAKNQPNPVQDKWLDQFFTAITDSKGRPLVKVHGFGSANVSLLRRLPFLSVDSAGWSLRASYGQLYIPQYINGKPDYLANPGSVSITGVLRKTKSTQSQQFDNLGALQQEAVRRFIEDEVGCDVGMVKHSKLWRYRAMATYYVRVAACIKDIRFKHKRAELKTRIEGLPDRPPKLDGFKFVFSTAYDNEQTGALRYVSGVEYVLLSYFLLKNRPEAIAQYANRELPKRGKVGLRRELQTFDNRRYRDMRARALIARVKENEGKVPA